MSDEKPWEKHWLINCDPRPVQLEALRRSYFGFRLKEGKNDDNTTPFRLPRSATTGWGHLLEMRLGKTPTTLAEFALFRRDHDFKNLVVFSPNEYKWAWADETVRFGIDIDAFVYESSSHDAVARSVAKAEHGVMISVNYEALKSDRTRAFLSKVMEEKTLLVADESIRIKNPDSLTTKGALELSKKAASTRILSGLPMVKGPHDLYAQYRFIGHLNGMNFYHFRNKFCKMGGFKGKQVKGVRNEEELEALMSSMSFVARRTSWADPLTPEYYQMRPGMTTEQTAVYNEMDRELVIEIGDEEVTVEQIISKMLKLQQISSGFVYNNEGKFTQIMEEDKIPKLQMLLSMLEEEIVGKTIIAYHYSWSGDLLRRKLEKYKPALIMSKQRMSKEGIDIESEKARFRDSKDCRVAIVNLTAGKYGHDLSGPPGDRCGTTIFYENNYSLDDRVQIEMRNTASTQDWTNVYIDFVSSRQEHKVVKALTEKRNLVEALLND